MTKVIAINPSTRETMKQRYSEESVEQFKQRLQRNRLDIMESRQFAQMLKMEEEQVKNG